MALDKLVDSTQLDSDLTSVANAIRAKSGGNSLLAFPNEFVSEIGNISAGGSLPSPITKVTCGTYTPASISSSHTFTHNLGCYPTLFYVGIEQPYYVTMDHFLFNAIVGYGSNGSQRANIRQETTNNVAMNRTNNLGSVTNTTIYINRASSTHGSFQPTINATAGDNTTAIPVTYFWIAIATTDSYVAT